MNCWTILGINKTKDKSVIKEAYIDKLSYINPEDDEEGFKELRKAYETALKECTEEEIYQDDNPVSIWIEKVEDMYRAFSRRIDENAWISLLHDDVCFGLDTKEDASLELLRFLMDNVYLPHKIWAILNQYFNWVEDKEDLYEQFPAGFVEYVEYKVNTEDDLNYELFEEIDDNKSYDKWLELYFKISRELCEEKTDDAGEDLHEISTLKINHPYLEVLKMKYFASRNEFNEISLIGRSLCEKYQDNAYILSSLAEINMLEHESTKAEELYKKVLAIKPGDYKSLVGIADCNFNIGNLEKARDLYIDLIVQNPYGNYVRSKLTKVNDMLIDSYKVQDMQNSTTVFKLGFCLYENHRYAEAIKIVKQLHVEGEEKSQSCILLGKLYARLKQHRKAILYFLQRRIRLELRQPKDDKLYSNLNEIYSLIGDEYYELNKYKKAMKYYNKVLKINSNDISALNCKSMALFGMHRYQESLKILEKAISLDDNYFALYINKSMALSKLGCDDEALFEAVKAQTIYPHGSASYKLQMKLYCEHDQYDNALGVYKIAQEYGAVNDEINLYKIVALRGNEDFDQAKECMISLLKDIKKSNDSCGIIDKVYYELSLLQFYFGDNELALKNIQEAIKISKKREYYTIRAYYYKERYEYKKALRDYKYIIRKFPNDNMAYNGAGVVYAEKNDYQTAIKYFKKFIENMGDKPLINVFIDIGMCYLKLEKYDEAIKYYDCGIELFSDQLELYEKKAEAYRLMGKYQEELDVYFKLLDSEEGIDFDFDKRKLYDDIGTVYEDDIKDHDEALKWFSGTIDTNKKS